MNTFLPYKGYFESALVLDRQRLGKQRVEVLQILRVLSGLSEGWKNHPAVKMWKGHEHQLALYGLCICAEWRRRGYVDNCGKQIAELGAKFPVNDKKPEWLTEEFCYHHRSNLVRKVPELYGKIFHGVEDNLPYIWPV